jgi:hypothetical protein
LLYSGNQRGGLLQGAGKSTGLISELDKRILKQHSLFSFHHNSTLRNKFSVFGTTLDNRKTMNSSGHLPKTHLFYNNEYDGLLVYTSICESG